MNVQQCNRLEGLLDADLFRALSDPNRLAILCQLAAGGGACTVGAVAGCCSVDLSVVSRHLRALKDAGVLEAEKRGRRVFYRVRFSSLSKRLRELADAIDACCPPGCCAATSTPTSPTT